MRHIHSLLIALLLITALGIAQPPPHAHAATTITVNTAEDDTDVGDGCSLREAITNANDDALTHPDCLAGTGNDTILFNSGFGAATILLGSPLPVVTDADGLTINGTGVKMTASGGDAVRVFEVGAGAVLTIQNLTLTNGFGKGGGVYNSGTVTIKNSTIQNSDGLDPGSGGGIYNDSGTVTISNSTLTGNVAASGGAIYNNTGTLTLTNSTIYTNSIWGSGSSIVYNGGTMTVKNSILADGSGADLCGGAVFAAASTNNLSDDATCGASFTQKTPAELALAPLADNGGPTATFGLLAASEAIDAADDDSCPSTDQRGTARPQGTQCDVGSFEAKISLSRVPSSLAFGSQLVGVKSAAKSVTITNTGEVDLVLGALSISGDFFLLNNTCNNQTLAPSGTCAFKVKFLPLSATTKTGTVSIPNNTAASPASVSLGGTGVSAVQLLKSPGFDTLTIPIPWRVTWPTKSLDSVRDCTVSHTPLCSIKFMGSSLNLTRTVHQIVAKTGVAGDKYYFGMVSRAHNVPAGGQYKVEILFYNYYNQVIGSRILNFTNGTHEFESRAATYTVPEAYYRIVFRFTFQKTSGTVWFDTAILTRSP